MTLTQAEPLPEPLRAEEQPSFTHFSVVVRLPDIARRVLAENDFPPEAAGRIQALIDEIPLGAIRPLAIEAEPFCGLWEGYARPYLGQNWLQVPWFFAEEYFYARILEAAGYFRPGGWFRHDPYADQKRLGLESSRAQIRLLADQAQAAQESPPGGRLDALETFILADLWGNQNDLSMWPVRKPAGGGPLEGGSAAAEVQERLRQRLLADDTPALLDYFGRLDPAKTRVDIVLDNAGYELVADLVLADFLLAAGLAAQVLLHTKSYPVFVSDALDADVLDTLAFLLFDPRPACRALAVRLRLALVAGKLRLAHHPFWTSPQPLWELPCDLLDQIRPASLLISKGDANYRRLLGDRHWPPELPFGRVTAYYPGALLALRTLKSEIAVGIDPHRTPQDDPDWMINGRWGLIQFSH